MDDERRDWLRDAKALLEMGAKMIDAKTVDGLVRLVARLTAENERLRDALEQLADYTDDDREVYGFAWRESRAALLGISPDDPAEVERAWAEREAKR